MELIPVLSTIILVATITTFILAIGAYVLYKRREKYSESYTPVSAPQVRGEYITPVMPGSGEYETSPGRRMEKLQEEVLDEKITLTGKTGESQRFQVRTSREGVRRAEPKRYSDKFLKYTSEGYISAKENDERGSLKWR
jgi:hypothetical protein